MNMITIGVDFHKKTSSYHVLDEDGRFIMKRKLDNEPNTIVDFLDSIEGTKQLSMEATRSWSLYHDLVINHVDEFNLGHPKKMKAITSSERKNDSADAEMIARLTHSNFLPKAHATPLDIRQIRSLVRYRGYLVNLRRSIRNQVHSIIDRNIWHCQKPQSFKNIFCKRGIEWLKSLEVPLRERFLLDKCLDIFNQAQDHISQIETFIKNQESDLPGLTWLRTVPGFKTSTVNVYCVLVETSDITRFRKAKGYAYYAGFVPKERSSGDKQITGRLIKGANMHLRTAIIESTLSAIRVDKGLRAYYLQVKARRGSGPAIVASARKLSYAIYHVLKEQRPYRPFTLNSPAAACHPTSITRTKVRG